MESTAETPSLLEPLQKHAEDFVLLAGHQLGINWQAEYLPSKAMGYGKGAAIGKPPITGLLVESERIVNLAADPGCLEVSLKSIAAALSGDAKGVLVPDVTFERGGPGKDQPGRRLRV